MLNADEFIGAYLEHELPYDPVKAHEYYLKTRELKGRRSVADLKGKSKKEGWAYTKSQIDERHKLAVKNAALANTETNARLALSAKQKREVLSERLKTLLIQMGNDTKAKQDQIKKEVNANIAAVPKVPEGLSKEETAILSAKRQEEIAILRGDATSKLKGVSEQARLDKKNTGVNLDAERKRLIVDIKTQITKSKFRYKDVRAALKAKYEAELDAQFNNIKNPTP